LGSWDEITTEINKAIGLIPEITGFIINSTDTRKNIMTPSLKLIAKLINIEGDLGDTFREKIFGQPFFFSNLFEILVDDNSHTTQWKPMMVIIAKIILKDTSKNIEIPCYNPKVGACIYWPL
jgi:hypothetical protein